MDNLRSFFIVICLFSPGLAGATINKCPDQRNLARQSDSQIIAAVTGPTGVGKCKMSQISNGGTTWIQVSGVHEFRTPAGPTLVQEEYPTGNSEAYDWAMQNLLIRLRQKLIYCECTAD